MAVEIRVPQMGESVTEAVVGQWLKKEGDTVLSAQKGWVKYVPGAG